MQDLNAKLLAEVAFKNRLISDMKTKQDWNSAACLAHHVHMNRDKQEMDPSKIHVLQTLLHLKSQVQIAKESVEQQELTLLALTKKYSLAQEQVTYLKSITSTDKDSKESLHESRIYELESRLKETLHELSLLQSKVSSWARNSKRHQESRVIAEAISKSLTETLLESDQKMKSLHDSVQKSQERLAQYQSTVKEAYETIESLEHENLDLKTQLAIVNSAKDVNSSEKVVNSSEKDVNSKETLTNEINELTRHRDELALDIVQKEQDVLSLQDAVAKLVIQSSMFSE